MSYQEGELQMPISDPLYGEQTSKISDRPVILLSKSEFEWFKAALQMHKRDSPIYVDRWKLKKLDIKIFGVKET